MGLDTSRRHRTEFPGVYYRLGARSGAEEPEKIYYIIYRVDGRKIEENVGRELQDGMTARKASGIRDGRIRESGSRAKKAGGAAQPALPVPASGEWTIDQVWSKWLELNPDKDSAYKDSNRYKTHLEEPFGSRRPEDLDFLEVEEFRKKLRKECAVGTVLSILSLLRRIINYGVNNGWCRPISFKIKMPKSKEARMVTEDMTERQLGAYIRACKKHDDPVAGNCQLFELFTGVRMSEARKLTWDKVNFHHRFIRLKDPKSGQDEEIIPMSDITYALLKELPRDGNYVFPGKRGGWRGLKQIHRESVKIRAEAGLPKDFRPNHGLRHTFASHLASSGKVDLYTLQKLLTHKSPATTQRYAHLTDEARRRGANVMGEIVAEAEGSKPKKRKK